MTSLCATLRPPSGAGSLKQEHNSNLSILASQQLPWSSPRQPSAQEAAEWSMGDCHNDSYQAGITSFDDGKSFNLLLEEIHRVHLHEMTCLQAEILRLQQAQDGHQQDVVASNIYADDRGVEKHLLAFEPNQQDCKSFGNGAAVKESLSQMKESLSQATQASKPRSRRDVKEDIEAEVENTKVDEPMSITRIRDSLLETVPLIVIMANAGTMAMSFDVSPKSSVWPTLEYVWVGCYSLEFICKILSFGLKDYFFGDNRHWNWFDFACLFVSLIEICSVVMMSFIELPDTNSILGFLKLLRLARLSRLVRALRFKVFDELKQMVLGVVFGFRVLIWAIVLLFCVISVLGIVMRDVFGDSVYELRTVPNAMFTMFRCFTDGCVSYDGTPLSERMLTTYGAPWFFFYILCFTFVTCGVFNLIMAIFLDNVVTRSLKRRMRELSISKKQTKSKLRNTLYNLIDEGTIITRDTFNNWLSDKEIEHLLEMADIDVSNKEELFDVLDVDLSGDLALDKLIDGLMRMRGPITKSDLVAIRLKLRYVTPMIEDMWRSNGKYEYRGSWQTAHANEGLASTELMASDNTVEFLAR